ncbi:hypothetical protein [Anabaena sp. CCY 9402-a]|uniref:hypothetical protein n=1 Tax=Anabaena sp. CCY 9402-a TaxID=3103867 RepID=UPI0039C6171D
MDRNRPLTLHEYDFIALHRTLNPSITRAQLTDLVQVQFGITMTRKQLTTALEKSIPIIKKFKADDSLCIKVAKEVGIIKLGHKVLRIQVLEKIVDTALQNGHEQASVAAIKLIKEELGAEDNTQDIKVFIGTTTPPQQEEDEDEDDEL